jgi:polyhydroxyalkanoate synthesis regulator phasin
MDTRVIQAFRSGNTELVDHLINKGDLSEEQAAKLKEESEKPDNIRHLEKMKIDRALQYYQQSKPEDRRGMDEIIGEKYNRFQSSNASPNEKKRIEKLYSKIINQ